MDNSLSPEMIKKLRAELDLLDQDLVEIDGIKLKPSKCYYFGINPGHILFNTNCPENLKEKVESILLKYKKADENRKP